MMMMGGGIVVFNHKGQLELVTLNGWDTRRRCRYQTGCHERKKSIEWEKSTSLNILSAPYRIYHHLPPLTLSIHPPSPANESFPHHKCNSSILPHAQLPNPRTYTRIIRRVSRMQRKKRGNKPPIYISGYWTTAWIRSSVSWRQAAAF